MLCCVYAEHAVAFFYGAWRVKEGAYSGGQVMQVFVAALLGGFSLGQVCDDVMRSQGGY